MNPAFTMRGNTRTAFAFPFTKRAPAFSAQSVFSAAAESRSIDVALAARASRTTASRSIAPATTLARRLDVIPTTRIIDAPRSAPGRTRARRPARSARRPRAARRRSVYDPCSRSRACTTSEPRSVAARAPRSREPRVRPAGARDIGSRRHEDRASAIARAPRREAQDRARCRGLLSPHGAPAAEAVADAGGIEAERLADRLEVEDAAGARAEPRVRIDEEPPTASGRRGRVRLEIADGPLE